MSDNGTETEKEIRLAENRINSLEIILGNMATEGGRAMVRKKIKDEMAHLNGLRFFTLEGPE